MTPLLLAALMTTSIAGQAPGQAIRAKDGDVILVENDDKVRVIRRRHANLRIIHNAEQRWVIVLADWLTGPNPGDGRVDYALDLSELNGPWPLGPRWEGPAFLEQYEIAGVNGAQGLGISTESGLVQFLTSPSASRGLGANSSFADAAAVAVLTFRSSSTAMGSRDSFDAAEQRARVRAGEGTAGNTSGGLRTSVAFESTPAPGASGYPPPSQPVRVGGNIRQPQKLKDADAVIPRSARQAGVSGTVIMEIVIGPDGTVQSAKVLRGVKLLDDAAVAAVKQWVYEPTLLNGAPVPVIMTVMVPVR